MPASIIGRIPTEIDSLYWKGANQSHTNWPTSLQTESRVDKQLLCSTTFWQGGKIQSRNEINLTNRAKTAKTQTLPDFWGLSKSVDFCRLWSGTSKGQTYFTRTTHRYKVRWKLREFCDQVCWIWPHRSALALLRRQWSYCWSIIFILGPLLAAATPCRPRTSC